MVVVVASWPRRTHPHVYACDRWNVPVPGYGGEGGRTSSCLEMVYNQLIHLCTDSNSEDKASGPCNALFSIPPITVQAPIKSTWKKEMAFYLLNWFLDVGVDLSKKLI